MYAAVLILPYLLVHGHGEALLCRDCVGLGYWVTLPRSQLIGGGYGYGLGSRVLQAEPLFEGAIDRILPGGSFREVPVRVRGVGSDHIVAAGPVVLAEPHVVEVHGSLGEIALGARSCGTDRGGASRPDAVVVEVHRALGHEVGAIGQDLE